MWKLIVLLICATLCVHAEEEQQPKTDQIPSTIVETFLCYADSKPWNCVKEQAGRMLDYWEEKVEAKRHELMVEADEEIKKDETSRGLTDEEKKETPSEIMSTLDKSFSALANLISDEVENFRGRSGRALGKKQQTKLLNDDDANDFNDDLFDGLSRQTGNSEEERGKALRGNKKGNKNGGYEYEAHEQYGYGYGKGKKGKKHKKGMMKLLLLGAMVKAKIEMLLKVLSFHLQLKFFAVALINMIINLARFWIDLKKQPQKVVYVEHAQHQHHYDDHDEWGSSWKRNTGQQEYNGDFAHRLAYSNSHPTY